MNTFILKTETELQKSKEKYKNFLAEASRRSFWQRHFENHNFIYQPEKFDWDYWQKIPFFTKEDFLKIGLAKRLADLEVGVAAPAKTFGFRVTSGTTRSTEPILTIRGTRPPSVIPEDAWRTLWLYSPYTLALRGALLNNLCNEREGIARYQTLVVDPYLLAGSMREAILEFHADNISGFPFSMSRFTSFFAESGAHVAPPLKRAYFGGDFLSDKEEHLIRAVFPTMELELAYGIAEYGKVGLPCHFLIEHYGRNAYHPRKSSITELLIEEDQSGIGEIVATKPSLDFGLIRYRTGDIGRAVHETCACGGRWTLILEGRKGFDVVKCAGAMIVRQELERVINELRDSVADWRAEARDILLKNRLVGELTIRVKPTPVFAQKNINRVSYLAEVISGKLYVTPTETLKNLADSQRFMPLKIELVEDFPETPKRVPLRKVNTVRDSE